MKVRNVLTVEGLLAQRSCNVVLIVLNTLTVQALYVFPFNGEKFLEYELELTPGRPKQ